MSVGRRCALLLAGGVLLGAAGLSAQTLPVPSPPPLEREGPPSEPGVLPESIRVPSWEYALGFGAGWESNIDFLVPNGPSGLSLSPRGGLARVFSSPHGQLRATASGSWTGMPDHPDLRRYNADLGLVGTWHPAPGTSWRANASYGLGYSDSSAILLEQGVALPVVKTRSLAAALGLSRQIGARTSLRVDGRFYDTVFDSAALIDGRSLRGTVGLQRQLGPRSTGAVEYSLESVFTGQPYLSQFASFQWTRVLSPRSALLLEAGGSYTPDAVRAGLEQKANLFGGGSLTRQVKRSSLTLFVRREVAPAFGTGTSRLELRLGLGASVPMGRWWTLRVAARHNQPEAAGATAASTVATGLLSRSDDLFAALSRQLGSHLEASAETRYRRRGAVGALAEVEAFQAGVFVTLVGSSGSGRPSLLASGGPR
jgi:hypothetical protein